jgi:hypothetical protein
MQRACRLVDHSVILSGRMHSAHLTANSSGAVLPYPEVVHLLLDFCAASMPDTRLAQQHQTNTYA